MGVDSFICGKCQQTFHDINIFIQHKNEDNCASSSYQDPTVEGTAPTGEIPVETQEATGRSVLIEVQGEDGRVEIHELHLNSGEDENLQVQQGLQQVIAGSSSLATREIVLEDAEGQCIQDTIYEPINIAPQNLSETVHVIKTERDGEGEPNSVQLVQEVNEDGQISVHVEPAQATETAPEAATTILQVENSAPGQNVSFVNVGQPQVRRVTLVPVGPSAAGGTSFQMVAADQSPQTVQALQPVATTQQTRPVRRLTLVPVSQSGTGDAQGAVNLQLVMAESQQERATSVSASAPAVQPQKSGRRRGRPRKGEEKQPKVVSMPKEQERPALPEIGADGQYHCNRCKKGFRKARHFNSHKCLALSNYVDITNKDLLQESSTADVSEEGEEEDEENMQMDTDPTPDFKYWFPKKQGLKKKYKRQILSSTRGEPDSQVATRPRHVFISTGTPGNQLTTMLKPDQDESTSVVELQPGVQVEIHPVSDNANSNTATESAEERKMGESGAAPSNLEDSAAASVGEKDKEVKAPDLDLADTEAQLIATASSAEPSGIVANPDVSLSDALGVLPMDTTNLPIAVVDSGLLETKSQQELEEEGPSPPPAVRRGRKPKKIVVSSEPARTIDQIPDLPVFVDEAEKLAFEQCLNVDLSHVDHMFKTHVIQQDVNDKAPPVGNRASEKLSVYSCTECDKVFMSLSHMRLHCLIHTNLKPYRCNKCDYSNNTKGNLYTHMRWHTGQLYRCPVCDFVTVNKAHLAEHEATHSGVRHNCQICKRDYNTKKSLINHVKRSHGQTKAGKDYLQEFQPKHSRGPAMLHQCHVCDRKFKKKVDRDRHLFVHNLKPPSGSHVCELCNYTATRRVYLQQHYRKHRVVYVCSECGLKHPSTIRLQQHFSSHVDAGVEGNDLDATLDKLLKESLGMSLFLPEASGVFENWNHDDDDLALIQEPNSETVDEEKDAEEHQENAKQQVAVKQEESSETCAPISSLPSESLFQEEGVDTAEPVPPSAEDEDLAQKAVSPDVEEDAAGENAGAAAAAAVTDEDGGLTVVEMEEEAETLTDVSPYLKMGYTVMGTDIFQKLQKTFGSEECEFCGRLFYSKSDHEAHIRTHTGNKPFACDQCDYRSITKDNLKRHIEREHDKVCYACSECDFTATSRTRLWHHHQTHKEGTNFECKSCNLQFENFKRLKTHLQVKHRELGLNSALKLTNMTHKARSKIGKKSYKCPYCSRTFLKSNSDLQKHLWIHEGIKPFKCTLCNHATRSKNNLMSHMLRHSNEKPFLCTHCGKAYKSRTALRWHVRSHKDGKLFKCGRCCYEATQKSHLKRHMETHNVVKKFLCEHCDYSSNTLGYMKIHYTRSHKGQQYQHNPAALKPMAAGTKVYSCLSCDYLFGNLTDMKRHLRMRHHVQVQDLHELESLDLQQATHIPVQIVARDEVVEVDNTVNVATTEEDASATLQALQGSVPSGELDEKSSSAVSPDAVSLLQQIINMSHQGAFSQQAQSTEKPEDAQGQNLVTINPESIVVNSEGEEVVVASDNGQQNQYVIQYRYVTEDGQEVITDKAMSDVNVEEVTIGDLIGETVSLGGVPEVIGHEVTGSEVMGSDATELTAVKSEDGTVAENSKVVTRSNAVVVTSMKDLESGERHKDLNVPDEEDHDAQNEAMEED